ncbi:16S rRNA (guanine(1207)-N(2))-methyltransferase RsmC [Aurantivibrio plasticivorans]
MKHSLQDYLVNLVSESAKPTLWVVDESTLPLYENARIPNHVTVLTNRYTPKNAISPDSKLIVNDFDFSQFNSFERIIYRISKEKPLVHHCINQSLQHLTDTGELILIGEKQDGIKSIAKHALNTFEVDGVTKKQGSFYVTHIGKPTSCDSELDTQHYTNLRKLNADGQTFYSKPGIFGWEKVDQGSTLLLKELPRLAKHMKHINSILDLGCGWGYLMCGTQALNAERRVATDNNAAAIDAAKKNCEELSLTVDVVLDDCGSNIKEKFDLILCNPPFHQGFSVENTLLEKFLKNASRMSRRSTRCLFVVNQFIPLDKVADKYFSEITLSKQQNGFKVWQLKH